MSVQDLMSRIETARNSLQEARNQMPRGEHRAIDTTRPHDPHYLETYDRDRAVQYALEYAENPNPEYIVFGNDCTNFATQVLIAGGVINYEDAEDPDGAGLFAPENFDPANWWGDKRRLDTSFIRAAELPQYLEENNLASLKPVDPVNREAVYSEIRSTLEPGDLIAYEHDEDSEADHVNVFLGFNEDGVAMIANHTPGKVAELRWEEVKTLIHVDR